MKVHANFNVEIDGKDFSDCYDKANTIMSNIKYTEGLHLTGLNMNESLELPTSFDVPQSLLGRASTSADSPVSSEDSIQADKNVKLTDVEDDIPF